MTSYIQGNPIRIISKSITGFTWAGGTRRSFILR